ncbi:extracellular solute-binding protein [Cohnella thailandensis]|uniref:Extracellular solute-binding protein n=1 Tax=Cohnella thailandensis TaxID=557557 RepID=A0A841SK05_9BACL|nr:extracellular solute-binding protein [Cohnella thailandensis]MBB6632853.1 extracellular solute-binding protein [Cohnella thailandensis]MBP1975453.1 putative aldouronate transport system substrate-binding protein [Cohnella thailandensis]
MNRKRLAVLVPTSVALALIVGCGNNEETTSSPSPAASGSASGTKEASAEAAKPTKITIMAGLNSAEVPTDKIEKLIEEKTNTELEIQWVPATIYNDKVNAAFATDALPMVFTGDLNKFSEAIVDGQFWEIGPYLSEYENLSHLSQSVIDVMKVDGKLYSLYSERPFARQGLTYRKDWADKLGLSAPTNLDEFYEMLNQFKNNDPDGNGKNDTIGLTDRSDLIFGAFKTVASWHGTPNYWGEKDGKLLPEFMFPEYMETMKFFQKLHREGLINQDFPVTSKEDQRALFINGTAGAYVGSLQDAAGLKTEVTKSNPNAVLDVQNRIEGPKGPGVWELTQGGGTVYLFPKSAIKSEEQLKEVLGFYDRLMSPELANLLQWGVEGEHYTVVDGLAKAVDDKKLLDREVSPYRTSIAVGGDISIPERLREKVEDPLAQKANELILDNVNFMISDPTAPLESKTFVEMGPRLQQSINDATYQFILGEIDEAGFQKAVDKWLADGGQKIIDEYTAAQAASQ